MTPTVGIVHLGLGAFWRAFGLPWIEEVDNTGVWGTIGVSLRSPTVRDALAPQGFAYHALEKGADGTRVRRVEGLRSVLVAPEDPGAVVAAMADPRVHLVTLTVTEKGYCHSPATGALNLDHPGIQHDLDHVDAPQTVPGFLVAALARRRAANVPPFTAMSCDNLPGNGSVLRAVVLEFAQALDTGLADWIAAEGTFPATMIDRIVPATTEDDLAEVERLTRARDRGAVVHEPFRQWVIEDRFAGPRPAFEEAGVLMTGDVAPYEEMKLRCLNGTHSAMAYLGVLAGKESVADAVTDPAFRRFAEGLWCDEIVPSFAAPDGVDLAGYTTDLMARYANPAVHHRTIQIAMDGSQKLPQRILGTIADNLRDGRPVARLCLVVAAWIRFLRGENDAGSAHEVNDPLATELMAAARGGDPVISILATSAVISPALAGNVEFRAALSASYDALAERGVKDVLEDWE